MKKAWMMTHDTYVDRRIFFFADVLMGRGYDVKLFADEYYDALCKDDPEYVIRPEVCTEVRRYDVPVDRVPEWFKKIVSKVVEYQNHYYKRNHKWSNSIPYYPDSDINIYTTKNDYIIATGSGTCIYCYEGMSRTFLHMTDSEHETELSICEKALRGLLRGEQMKDLEKRYEIQISTFENKTYLHPYCSRLMYIYDSNSSTLKEYKPMEKTTGELDKENVNYRDFQTEIYDYDRIFSRIKKELEREVPDIVYVADLTTLPIAIMLKEQYGCKVIMDCHEWWYKQTVLWEPERKKKQKLSDYYEGKLYPKCDLVITVGEYLAGRMKQAYGCDFEVIYSCMSRLLEEKCLKAPINIREKYNLSESAKIAVFQGGMTTHRNLENLARATKYMFENSYLLLLTNGQFQDVFKRILKKEGNPDRVIWGGWIPQEDLLRYTRAADIGIIPYRAENDYAECFVPNKLMEYFTTKLPILYDSSMRELCLVAGKNHVGKGSDLSDPRVFGRAIDDMLRDEEALQQYRANYENCVKRYNYEGQKEAFENMLESYHIME